MGDTAFVPRVVQDKRWCRRSKNRSISHVQKQLFNFEVQPPSDPGNVVNGHISNSCLDIADVGLLETGPVPELFLAHAELFSPAPHVASERLPRQPDEFRVLHLKWWTTRG
jgi:hypothetical protein